MKKRKAREAKRDEAYDALVEKTTSELIKANPHDRHDILDKTLKSFSKIGGNSNHARLLVDPKFQSTFITDTTLWALEIVGSRVPKQS